MRTLPEHGGSRKMGILVYYWWEWKLIKYLWRSVLPVRIKSLILNTALNLGKPLTGILPWRKKYNLQHSLKDLPWRKKSNIIALFKRLKNYYRTGWLNGNTPNKCTQKNICWQPRWWWHFRWKKKQTDHKIVGTIWSGFFCKKKKK